MRGTELPRTESREGRKKASADVSTMSRAKPRSRTCKVGYQGLLVFSLPAKIYVDAVRSLPRAVAGQIFRAF